MRAGFLVAIQLFAGSLASAQSCPEGMMPSPGLLGMPGDGSCVPISMPPPIAADLSSVVLSPRAIAPGDAGDGGTLVIEWADPDLGEIGDVEEEF